MTAQLTYPEKFYTYSELEDKINNKNQDLREVVTHDANLKQLNDNGVVTITLSENGKKCLENALKMTDNAARKYNLYS